MWDEGLKNDIIHVCGCIHRHNGQQVSAHVTTCFGGADPRLSYCQGLASYYRLCCYEHGMALELELCFKCSNKNSFKTRFIWWKEKKNMSKHTLQRISLDYSIVRAGLCFCQGWVASLIYSANLTIGGLDLWHKNCYSWRKFYFMRIEAAFYTKIFHWLKLVSWYICTFFRVLFNCWMKSELIRFRRLNDSFYQVHF